MTPDQDCSSYCIDDTLLLRFLIVRFTDMLGSDIQRLDPVWQGLGMVALHQNKELKSAFQTLISSDSYTYQEVLTCSINLFLVELNRLQAVDSTAEFPPKKIERRPLSPKTARGFLRWCWREGRKLERQRSFEFYPVWALILWLALQSDEEIQEFDEKCRFSSVPLEEKIDEGLNIIKEAIFKRRRKVGTSIQNN
ncbi:MAG: hypothetical protein ACLP5H_03675 [Desulfomonilaceae bacterium]